MEPSWGGADKTAAKNSFLKTCFNALNAIAGVGILSLPYAVSSGGWISLVPLFAIAVVTFYTAILVKRCMDFNNSIRSYPDIGYSAFGSKGKTLVSIFTHTELYMAVTSFLILEADILDHLFPGNELQIAGLRIGGKKCFLFLSALLILPSVLLKDNLKLLPYVSASGVVASTIIVISVIWVGAVDGVGFDRKGRALNMKGLPISISLYAFNYAGHAILPSLYTSMKKTNQFFKVLLLCFVSSTVLFVGMGVSGYLMFGSGVKSQVTLSLPIHKTASKVAAYTALAIPLSKYALVAAPVIQAIEESLHCEEHRWGVSLLIRATVVLSTVVVALAVPFFGSLVSLVGAFLNVTVSIILPCLCYLKISNAYQGLGMEVVVISGIIVMGGVIAILGTYASLMELASLY